MDAYSKYTWIYFLGHKSDAISSFILFKKYVKTQFYGKMKSIQSYFGGEFIHFTQFLNELGIVHKLTYPHTSHQNVSLEEKHIQIMDMGLTLLAHATMQPTFWDYNFTNVVYLMNIIPTSALPEFTSPFSALYHMQPDYTSLKIFRCACYPHLRTYNQRKLEFGSSKCVYFGFSPTHKGHKCMNMASQVFISKDVIFNEEEFPFETNFKMENHASSSQSPRGLSSLIPNIKLHTFMLSRSCFQNGTTSHNLRTSVYLK